MPHLHEKIDLTVEVFVVCKDKVLLRRHDKYGMWLSVGGHVELDEDPNQAAIREVKEEVGLAVRLIPDARRAAVSIDAEERAGYRELIPPLFLNRHRISSTHEHVTMTYVAVSSTDVLVVSEHERSAALHWFTREEIECNDELMPHVQVYALAALHAVALYASGVANH